MSKWYALGIEEVEKKLMTNVSTGLSPKEVSARLRRFGYNNIYKTARKPFAHHAVGVVSDISVILFAVLLVVGLFFGDRKQTAAALILFIASVVLSTVCRIVSALRFENTFDRSYPSVSVLRDGKVYRSDIRDIVAGDVILLKKGDIVPCDCRLISSENLRTIEFVGKVSGREQKKITVKNADRTYSASDKPSIAERENMVSAAAVVSSGSGRAVAVATGENTFIGMILGELELCAPRKRELAIASPVRRFLSKCTTAFLIAVVPVTAVAAITGKNEYNVIDIIITIIGVSLFFSSDIVYGVASLIFAVPVKRAAKNGAIIKSKGAIEDINYIDSVVIVGNDSFSVREKKAESVYAANKFYDVSEGKETQNDEALRFFAELAFLGAFGRSNRVSDMSIGDSDTETFESVRAFSEKAGCDTDKALTENVVAEYLPSRVSEFDTTLVKNGEEYRVICFGENTSLVGICTDMRTPNGTIPLDPQKKAEIISACSQFVKKSKKVSLVASRISPCSSLSRLGAVQNQMIFEGYIVYADPYSKPFADRVREMREADINVYYFADEKAEDIITAFNTGLVGSKKEIAYASAFARNGKKITNDLGRYHAYLGFGAKQLTELVRAIRGEDGTVAVIASETDSLSLMNASNVSVAVSDYRQSRDGITKIVNSSEIIKKTADVLVTPPTKSGGGFESFCRAVLFTRSACRASIDTFEYLAFSLVVKIILSVLPLILGKRFLVPVQIMAVGTFVDIPAMVCFAFSDKNGEFSDRTADVESFFGAPFIHLAKYFAAGGVFGVVVLLMTAVFGSYGIASGEPISVFAALSVIFGDLFAAKTILNPTVNKNGAKIGKYLILHAVLLFIFAILAVAFPSVGAVFGMSYPGWQICFAAPLVSVIGYVVILVTDRYI